MNPSRLLLRSAPSFAKSSSSKAVFRQPLSSFASSSTRPAVFARRTTAATARTMASTTKTTDTLLEAFAARRSHYALSKELPVSKDRVQDIVKEALRQVPSSFNAQSNRVVVLFGAEHDKFWGLVTETLKAIVPADAWAATEGRLTGFKAGAGTVLFFDDQTVIETQQANFALYADRFPGWAQQSNGMLQFAIWTALEAEGLGANLQHYNPLVDDKVAATWKVPATWKLNAQLVFGGLAGDAQPKTFQPLDERYKVYGA